MIEHPTRHLCVPLATGLAAWLAAVPVAAQSFTDTGPAPRLVVPQGTPRTAQSRDDAPPLSAAEGRPEPRNEPRDDRPLGARLAGLRPVPAGFCLAGEDAAWTWTATLTEKQAAEIRRLSVGYLGAISIAPESSDLSISVNGTALGLIEVRAPGAVKVVEFEVPSRLLRSALDAVRLAARQRHRVDCSIEATSEFSTQIDPARTGFVVRSESGPRALAELAAIPADAGGETPIRVVVGGRPTPPALSRFIRAAQAAALAGRFARPLIDLGPRRQSSTTPGAGLDLVWGAASDIRALGLEPPVGTGPRSALVQGCDGWPASLVVTGEDEADLA